MWRTAVGDGGSRNVETKQRENKTEKRLDSGGGLDSSQVDPAELNTRKLRKRRRIMMFIAVHCGGIIRRIGTSIMRKE